MPYSERDIDALTLTMLGEAAGEGADGLQAVAHVALNRFNKGGYGNSIYSVVHAPMQFSAWNAKGNGGNEGVNTSSKSAEYRRARAIAEQVLNGQLQDNTGGAFNYFNPKGMTGKNGTRVGEPNWKSQMSYTGSVGNHEFYSPYSAAGAAEAMGRDGRRSIDPGTQDALRRAGFDPGTSDGINGPRTTAAIKAFQQARGLVPDGIVGPKTTAALQGQASPRTQRQPPPSPPALPFGGYVNNAFGATGGNMESPLSRLATTRLGWKDDDIVMNSTDIRAPTDPVEYARARDQAVGTRGAADPSIFSMLKPQQAVPPPLMPRSRPIMPPAPPQPMPGRPAALSGPPPGPSAPIPMPGRPASLNPSPSLGAGTWADLAGAPVIRGTPFASSGARHAVTTGVQPAGTVEMPPGARPASRGPAPPLPPGSLLGPSLGAGTWASMAAAPVVQSAPFTPPPVAPRPLPRPLMFTPFTGKDGNQYEYIGQSSDPAFAGINPAVYQNVHDPFASGRNPHFKNGRLPTYQGAAPPRPPVQYIRAPSGRSAASVGETFDQIWNEARG